MRGYLSEQFRGIIESVNPEFVQSQSHNECTRTDLFFSPYLCSAMGWLSLLIALIREGGRVSILLGERLFVFKPVCGDPKF